MTLSAAFHDPEEVVSVSPHNGFAMVQDDRRENELIKMFGLRRPPGATREGGGRAPRDVVG